MDDGDFGKVSHEALLSELADDAHHAVMIDYPNTPLPSCVAHKFSDLILIVATCDRPNGDLPAGFGVAVLHISAQH
jgi:hypothetical protein